MKDYLHSEVVNAIGDAGFNHGLEVRLDVRVTWNSLRSRDACIDVGWYEPDTGRFVAAWVIRGTASEPKRNADARRSAADLFDGCPAAMKIEVNDDIAERVIRTTTASIMHVPARDIVQPGATSTLNRLVSQATTTAAILNPRVDGLLRFLIDHLPEALPLDRSQLVPFSRGMCWARGVSTCPQKVSWPWLRRAHRFIDAANVPRNFYAAGIVSTNAEESIFAMWNGCGSSPAAQT